MPNRLVFALVALAALMSASAGAWAQSRFALVLGNGNYQTTTALPNPIHDAEAMKSLLNEAGFEVSFAADLDQSGMLGAVRDFAAKLANQGKNSVALVYFAGHGVQIDGENYIVPVDAKIAHEADVALEAVRLADVMNLLDVVPSRTRIIILDACRNNPFDAISGSTGRGLAIVNAPAGSMVAYSTSPGATAEDGTGINSPFTAAFIKAAREPGAPIEIVFQNVRLAVHKATEGNQTPWEVTALTEPFAFFPGQSGAINQAAPERSEQEWREKLRSYQPKEAYDAVVLQDTVVVYQIFLTIYPQSPWARIIRDIMERRLEMLAWFDAIRLNSVAAFDAFLARYPNSDLTPTARRMAERARLRSAFASDSPGTLEINPKPEIKTVVKEVKVPVVQEVIKEVKVPVVQEVIKEVKVPVVQEVIKEVRVPVPRVCPPPRECPKCPRPVVCPPPRACPPPRECPTFRPPPQRPGPGSGPTFRLPPGGIPRLPPQRPVPE
jgi:uncharacterized caspase-like protein